MMMTESFHEADDADGRRRHRFRGAALIGRHLGVSAGTVRARRHHGLPAFQAGPNSTSPLTAYVDGFEAWLNAKRTAPLGREG